MRKSHCRDKDDIEQKQQYTHTSTYEDTQNVAHTNRHTQIFQVWLLLFCFLNSFDDDTLKKNPIFNMPFEDDSSINIDDFDSTADHEVIEKTAIVTEKFSEIPMDKKQFGKYEKGDGSKKMTKEASEIPTEKKQGGVFKKSVVTEEVSEIPTEKEQDGRFKKGGGGKKTQQKTSGWGNKLKVMESF